MKKIKTKSPDPTPASPTGWRRPWMGEAIFVVALCLIFGALVAAAARSASATYDEVTHLPAGYSYWQWHDYRLNPEHPPLVKKWASLPLRNEKIWPENIQLRPTDVAPFDRQNPDTFPNSESSLRRAWAGAILQPDLQWDFGHYFLYGIQGETLRRLQLSHPDILGDETVPGTVELKPADFRNDADHLLFQGRMAVMVLGLLLCVLVYAWSRQLFGPAGAMLSLALICFDPTILAHSGLVTTDVGLSLFMFGAMFFLWRTFQKLTTVNATLFVLFFALAQVTKFSAILLVPMFLLVALERIWVRREWPVGRQGKMGENAVAMKSLACAGLFLAAALGSWLTIWGFYEFRYSAVPDPARAAQDEALVSAPASGPDRQPGAFPLKAALTWTAAAGEEFKFWPEGASEQNMGSLQQRIQRTMKEEPLTWEGRLILFAQEHRLLPEAYLYGFALVRKDAFFRASYLRGEYSNVGFLSYFAETFLLKTPWPALALCAAAAVCVVRQRKRAIPQLRFILIAGGLYLLVALLGSMNIGHRHLLPVYPFLYVVCGILGAQWLRWQKPWRWLLPGLVLTAIIASSQWVFCPPWRPQPAHSHYLAYFNEFCGGPREGYRNLVDSNLDWGQDLKTLKAWLDDHGVRDPIWLSYFGTADPRYYQIPHRTVPHMLGGYQFEPSAYDALENQNRYEEAALAFLRDLRPGDYIAVSATNLSGVYLGSEVHKMWQHILSQATLIDQVGYSILIYRVNAPES